MGRPKYLGNLSRHKGRPKVQGNLFSHFGPSLGRVEDQHHHYEVAWTLMQSFSSLTFLSPTSWRQFWHALHLHLLNFSKVKTVLLVFSLNLTSFAMCGDKITFEISVTWRLFVRPMLYFSLIVKNYVFHFVNRISYMSVSFNSARTMIINLNQVYF